MAQHKWHKEIKAWADGAEIESSDFELDFWSIDKEPDWNDEFMKYRIKPQPKEPQYLYVYGDRGGTSITHDKNYIPYDQKYIGKIKLEDDE